MFFCYLGFSHLVHASDVDQLEALLTRWGPDGLGKLGGQGFTRSVFMIIFYMVCRPTMGEPH